MFLLCYCFLILSIAIAWKLITSELGWSNLHDDPKINL